MPAPFFAKVFLLLPILVGPNFGSAAQWHSASIPAFARVAPAFFAFNIADTHEIRPNSLQNKMPTFQFPNGSLELILDSDLPPLLSDLLTLLSTKAELPPHRLALFRNGHPHFLLPSIPTAALQMAPDDLLDVREKTPLPPPPPPPPPPSPPASRASATSPAWPPPPPAWTPPRTPR